ncbi:MAG: sporulation protein YqfD [Clostridia bacterium]|nr:sporulation protein YqfD [Clostridia bacterium]
MKGFFSVRCRVTGLNVEKLINEARKRGLVLKKARREQNRALTVELSPQDCGAFQSLAGEMGYAAGPAEPLGMLRLIRRLSRRPGLWTGIFFASALLIWSLGYVWQISVENAGPYAGEIQLFLEENAIRPGVRRSAVNLEALREGLEWRLPKVKWVRAEWSGVTLCLRVEEGTPPPEMDDARTGDVVAEEDGVLKRLTVYAGTPMAKPGDLVKKGQVLIRGEERGKNGETVSVRARGEAIARAWITVRLRVPAVEYVSLPTGRSQERRILQTPAGSFCAESEEDYLISERSRIGMPLGGAWLPVTLIWEERTEVWLEKRDRDADIVRAEAEDAALIALEKAAYPHEMVDKWLNCGMIEGDNMIVTVTAEIEKDIGRSRLRNTP